MSNSTKELLAVLIRHAKGMLTAVEKWVRVQDLKK